MEENKGNDGHRRRIREKYRKGGYGSFLDYEIVELLLTYCIGRKDVKPIARALTTKYKHIEDILRADAAELLKIDGVGENTALFLRLIGDIATRLYGERLADVDLVTLKNKNDLLAFLRGNLAFFPVENFMVIYLDVKNRILKHEILFSGTIDKSAIYPREIIREVLNLEAKSVIFAHNHPSGDVEPSTKDKEFTTHMHRGLREFDIALLDHIIISRDSYFSFLEYGTLR